MDRAAAYELMCQHTPSDSLRRHMLGVECCLRWYATRLGADVEQWGLAGLLHDFDYEQHPDEHPLWGIKLLESMEVDPAVVRAVAAHYPQKTGVEPESSLERHLFACDELSGFVTAVTYVRPSRSVHEVEVKSVVKKLKTPAFAAGVSRDDVARGAELVGLPLEEHIANVLAAMQGDAEALGLAGLA
ncbi:MAG: HD domain-containing protein [Fimbriimonadaceae bacterium]|nr:HD domain-containing protein [Fimbriimonadaceae bacterium]